MHKGTYTCGCQASLDHSQKKGVNDVMWQVPVPRELEISERLRQKREPVIELVSDATGTSLKDVYTQPMPNDAKRSPCSKCSRPRRVKNFQAIWPLGKIWLIALKRMHYDKNTTTDQGHHACCTEFWH